MTIVTCNPDDFEQLPWQPDCVRCAAMRTDPHPGLFTWVQMVAAHFDKAHGITLVGAG